MKKYIVFEGIHGSGKSSIAKGLADRISASYLHFPNEEDLLGKHIRSVLTNPDLVHHWEVLGLLYASASNAFHISSQGDDRTYVLERDSVTSGLVFQADIPWETRLSLYRFGIQNLREQGLVIYIDVPRELAFERFAARNALLSQDAQEQVWTNKANDQFLKKFDEYVERYQRDFFPGLDRLGIPHLTISNTGTLDEAITKAFLSLS